jgi:hypothetical protein
LIFWLLSSGPQQPQGLDAWRCPSGRRSELEPRREARSSCDFSWRTARHAVNSQLKTAGVVDEKFRFDSDEFNNQVGYRSVELDNGAMVTAPSTQFNQVIEQEVLDEQQNEVRISTRGKVVSERLRKA